MTFLELLKWFIELVSKDANHFLGFLIFCSILGTGIYNIAKLFRNKPQTPHE
jgi:hypothetical protein